MQLFRTGVIEAVDNYAFLEEEGTSRIDGDKFDEGLIKSVQRYFQLLRELGLESPTFLLLSIVGVGDYQMLQRGIPRHYFSELRPVDRDDLLIPEVMVESLEQDLHALQRHLKPLLDAVWNSVGVPRSPHYDENGNWKSRS